MLSSIKHKYICLSLFFRFSLCLLFFKLNFLYGEYVGDKGLSEECYQIIHSKDSGSKLSKKAKECIGQYLKVVVSATRSERKYNEVPGSIAVITSEDISHNASENLSDLVKDIPGIDIQEAGQAGFSRIRIRGELARRTAVLIDGQEFIDHREVGTPILIDTEQIERIEILKGSGSVLYGSRAIGGLVNIITKKGGYHKVQVKAGDSYNSATNGHKQYASLFGRIKNTDYRFFLAKTDANERSTPDGDLDDTSYSNDSAYIYLGHSFNKEHKLQFSYDVFDGSSDVWVDPQVRFHPPFKDFRIEAPQRDREKYALFYAFNNQRNSSSSIKKVNFDIYFQESRRQFNTFSDMEFNFGFPLEINSSVFNYSVLDTLGAHLQSDYIFGNHYVIFGAQGLKDSLEQSRLKQVVNNGVARPDELIVDKARQKTFALFVQDEWNFINDFYLTAGARQYFVDSELISTNRLGLLPTSISDGHLVSSVSIRYLGLESYNFWGEVSQGYAYPTLVQLATGAYAGPDFVNPNFNLDPETSNNFEVGIKVNKDKFSGDISLFYNRAKNYIDHVKCSVSGLQCIGDSGSRERIYINVGKSKTFGIEGSASYILGAFSPYFNISFLRKKLEFSNFSTYDAGVPQWSGKVGTYYKQEIRDFLLWADLHSIINSSADEKEDIDEINHTSGFALFNLAVGIDFGRKKQFSIIVEGRNLTDKKYRYATENIVSAGRSVLLKLTVKI